VRESCCSQFLRLLRVLSDLQCFMVNGEWATIFKESTSCVWRSWWLQSRRRSGCALFAELCSILILVDFHAQTGFSFCFTRHFTGFADRAENNTLTRALNSAWTLNKTLVWKGNPRLVNLAYECLNGFKSVNVIKKCAKAVVVNFCDCCGCSATVHF